MKIKGRESDTWHKNVDNTAGPRKPTDPDFPWIALQNHTGYYMKKKGKLSQNDIDQRLIALIQSHPSKQVAVAACGQLISVRTIRNFLECIYRLHGKPDSTIAYVDYLQVIVATNHVNPGAVSVTEAQWACCLLEHSAPGGPPCSLSQQLRNVLPLVSDPVAPGQLLHADVTALANDLCSNLAAQLKHLICENRWVEAYDAVGWLSSGSFSNLLQIPIAGERLLDRFFPKRAAWAAWRPDTARIRAWQAYAALAPSSLQSLLALEGPDFVCTGGNHQDTLLRGLVAQSPRGSQSSCSCAGIDVSFSNNPFRRLENLDGILERLTSVVDFACSAGREYTALLAYFYASRGMNNEVLQVMEHVQILGNPLFTKTVVHAFTLPRQNVGEGMKEIKQLLPALGDVRVRGLRDQLKPYVADRISNYIKELQSTFLKRIGAGSGWLDAAMELVLFFNGLQEETWLVNELDQFIQRSIASGCLVTIETLWAIRKSILSMTSAIATPLVSQVDAYCKARVIPDCEVAPEHREIVEILVSLWRENLGEDHRELAVLVADLPHINYQLKYECLRDIRNISSSWIVSTLETLKFPSRNPDMGIIALIRLLAEENRPGKLRRWRQVLSFAIEKRHEALLDHVMATLTVEKWFELLGNIRIIYKGSAMIKKRSFPRLFDLQLHAWSQQVVAYLPTLTRLRTVLDKGPAMKMLMLGPSGPRGLQLLQILQCVQACGSSYHQKVADAILGRLDDKNVDDIEGVVSAVSKACSIGAEACLDVLHIRSQKSSRFAELSLAMKLRAPGLPGPDRIALRKVAQLFEIVLDAEGNPSSASLKEVMDSLHEQYLGLITEAQRLENLRLSLRAVVAQDVSKLLAKLHIEAPSAVDDTLACLPPSLGSVVEKISKNEIELQFPGTDLTKFQRFAIGAGDAESFLIRLTLDRGGAPIKFCVHLSGDLSKEMNPRSANGGNYHTPWEVTRGRAPYEQYCRGRPNRGSFQLSRILWGHLRGNFKSLEHTHAHITAKLSKFGQGCMVCGVGQRRLRRATICSSPSCQSTFSEAHIEIQLAEIWQDSPVVDLLLTMIYAVASTGNLDLLMGCPVFSAPDVVSSLNALPAISAMAKHLKSCLHVHGTNFCLSQALAGCTSAYNSTVLSSGLLWACSSYRGFLVSATGIQRIPSFGNDQFLLVNANPDLEAAFSRHMPTPNSTSQILFHGTSLDRLHAIICQGLRVQSNTPLQRHGAAHGAGIYMADEPLTAWGYATASRGGWKSSNLKNMKVLLGCELAGIGQPTLHGIHVITDATRLAVRYIFLLASGAMMPAAKDVRLPMGSVFQSLRNGTC